MCLQGFLQLVCCCCIQSAYVLLLLFAVFCFCLYKFSIPFKLTCHSMSFSIIVIFLQLFLLICSGVQDGYFRTKKAWKKKEQLTTKNVLRLTKQLNHAPPAHPDTCAISTLRNMLHQYSQTHALSAYPDTSTTSTP